MSASPVNSHMSLRPDSDGVRRPRAFPCELFPESREVIRANVLRPGHRLGKRFKQRQVLTHAEPGEVKTHRLCERPWTLPMGAERLALEGTERLRRKHRLHALPDFRIQSRFFGQHLQVDLRRMKDL